MLADSPAEGSKCTGKLPAYWSRLRWKKFLISSDAQANDFFFFFYCDCANGEANVVVSELACRYRLRCLTLLTKIKWWILSLRCKSSPLILFFRTACLQSFEYFLENYIAKQLNKHHQQQSHDSYITSESSHCSRQRNLHKHQTYWDTLDPQGSLGI